MKIIKLTNAHVADCEKLFQSNKMMGVSVSGVWSKSFGETQADNTLLLARFSATYLSDLESFYSFGYFNECGALEGYISVYEDINEPSWYMTGSRNSGDPRVIRDLLDYAIKHNEHNGRYKFYTLLTPRTAKLVRRFGWSNFNSNRYDYIDEYVVPARTKCWYHQAWEILFNRVMLPVDTVVRCSFLKQEFRDERILGGSI
jgi:hypothetical protein